MELSDIVRQKPQVVIIEKPGHPDEFAEQAEYNGLVETALLTSDTLYKAVKEKSFQVPFDRL
jgi:hypothetical protein